MKYQELADKIKEEYTYARFAEDILGIKRNGLYKKLRGDRPFTKLEKDKILQIFDYEVE